MIHIIYKNKVFKEQTGCRFLKVKVQNFINNKNNSKLIHQITIKNLKRNEIYHEGSSFQWETT